MEDTRYYSAMVQAERLAAIGQTIATLSHHIKNILQGIRGGSYLIEMGLTEHDESIVGKGWKIVEKNQNKISALVMDMLTFSKEREPDLTAANLNTVVHDVVELMQARAQEEQVELSCQPAENMPDLVFDPEGIHRAVLNIVTNAIDAVAETDPPGRVTRDHPLSAGAERRPDRDSRHGARHCGRPDGQVVQPLCLDEEEPGHGSRSAREPEDPDGTRRQDHGREPSRSGGLFHAGAARREPRTRLTHVAEPPAE